MEHERSPQSLPFAIVGQALLFAITFVAIPAVCQSNPNIENGVKPYGASDGSDIDRVNLQAGGLNVRIPLFSYPQRGGLNLDVVLMLGSKSWHNREYDCPRIASDEYPCKGKWRLGPYTQPAWDGPGATEFGVYLAIDDHMPILSSQALRHAYGTGVASSIITDCSDVDTATPLGLPGDNQVACGLTPGTGFITWFLQSVWDLDGTRHYMWPLSSNTTVTLDGTAVVCLGCSQDPSVFNTQALLTRNGTRAVPNGVGYSVDEDRNGNLLNYSGADSMGRSVFQSLQQGTATTLDGCDPTQTSATLYTFPGPGDQSTGTSRQLKLCSQTQILQTGFGPIPFDDATGNAPIIQESDPDTEPYVAKAILYNGTNWSQSPAYSFEYNGGNPGGLAADGTQIVNFGDLTKITLPTGGTIGYTWGTFTPCDSSALLTPVSRYVRSRTVDSGDPNSVIVHNYYPGINFARIVDGSGNVEAHTFSYPIQTLGGGCTDGNVETNVTWSDSQGTVLKSKSSEYAAVQGPAELNFMPIGVRKTAETTTLDDGTALRVEYDYDTNLAVGQGTYYTTTGIFSHLSYGTLQRKRELPAGAAAGSTPLRCTAYTYKAFEDTNYISANEIDLPTSERVYAGSCPTTGTGTPVAQTTYGYDESGVQTSGLGSTAQLDTSPPTGSYRGNLTSTNKLLLPPTFVANGGNLTVTNTTIYYDTGLPYSTTDPKGYTTSYLYDPVYAGAYLTQTTMPQTSGVNHVVSATYDYNTGKVTNFTDQNSQVSTYTYDALGRIWNAHLPDAGAASAISKEFCYPSFTTITEMTALTSPLASTSSSASCPAVSGNSAHAVQSTYDGLGRIKSVADLGAHTQIDTTYDDLGRIYSVSDPYTIGTSVSGTKVYGYDPLNRPTLVTNEDSTTQSWHYVGLATTFCDEMPNCWTRTNDALGRLTQVTEPGLLNTTYSYDVLDNLLCVDQWGTGTVGTSCSSDHARSFVYDSLSRLLSSTNPEAGTIDYYYWNVASGGGGSPTFHSGYDANGNLQAKIDARGIGTNYLYDALNRLLSKTYSDGTPSSCYAYDTAGNGIGRLATEWTQSVTCDSTPPSNPKSRHTILTYDAMGRLLQDERCTGVSNCTAQTYRPMTYSYNLAGNPTSSSDGFGNRSFTTQYDAAGRLLNLIGFSPNSSPPSTVPLFSVQNYGPVGWTGASIGVNLSAQHTYDSRNRLTGETVVIP